MGILAIHFAYGQASGTNPNVNERPQAQAIPLETDPVIDGEVIHDEVWQQYPSFDGLKQVRPNAGQAASEKTDIRIGYTETMLYVSVVCYDSHPEKLVVSDARRDASLDGTDSFLFIIDTYHDRQNGWCAKEWQIRHSSHNPLLWISLSKPRPS